MKDILQTSGTELAQRVKNRTIEDAKAVAGSGYQAIRIDRSFEEELNRRMSDAPSGLTVRPHKDDGGIPAGRGMLQSLHTIDRSRWRGKNISPAHAFEPRYVDSAGTISLQFVPGGEDWLVDLDTHITDNYPNAITDETDSELLDISEGRYVAGAIEDLEKYTLHLIRNIELDGFERNPYGAITSEMASAASRSKANVDIAIQIMFRPVEKPWTTGVNGGHTVSDITYQLNQPNIEERRNNLLPWKKERMETPPSTKEKKAAKIMGDLYGEEAWNLNVRVFASADTPEAAELAVEKVADKFKNYYESSTKQRFVPQPLRGHALRRELLRAASREWVDQGLIFSEAETAGLVNCMDDRINTQFFNWTLSRAGYGVPPGTPRFDFEAHGVESASEEVQQAAMFDSSAPGEPYWFGTGSRNGVEAGVEEDVLQTHMFIGGESGYGKTTFGGKNLFKQIVDRGHGCLMYDPKGMDAEDIASLVPEEREDDLIYIELGSRRDHQVGFNFLEVPGNAEPGTPEHAAALESMADDLEAILPLAAGVHGEGSWGTRMSRIARNIARGLGKLDREVTLYDAHLIASEAAGREAYAQALDEEEINFIKDYAINHLQDMDDDALEPFSGRLQQLIENDTVREIVTLKDGFSIDEAVAEGKIIIVRDNDPSDTTGKMVATALIRRIWVSIREQTYDDDRPDPDQFYAILDEFKEIATVNSDVAEIFSDARSFGLSMIVMTQDLSSQLSDKIMEAVEGQAETFITFNPGRKADAQIIESQHSKDMEAEDLLELPKYRFLMRTHDEEGELTHSYKVNAFPPVDELEGMRRSPEETEELIDRRIREVGSLRRTDEDIMSNPAILSASSDSDDGDNFEVTEDVKAKTCKAVYDEAIRQSAEDGWVRVDQVADRIRRYLPDDAPLSTTAKLWGNLIDHLPESHLEREDRGNAQYLRCTDEGKTAIFASGAAQNSGGAAHRLLLRDAYKPLTELGFVTEIPDQSGENLPDAVCRLDDVDTLQFDPETETVKDIANRVHQFEEENPLLARLSDANDVYVEAESTTATTAPAQTLLNLKAAVESGHRCLFLARTEEVAERIWDVLSEDPVGMREYEKRQHRLYNANDDALSIGGMKMYRPAGPRETVWLYDETVDQYLLSDSDDEVHARFDSAEDIFAEPEKYPLAEGETADYEDWAPVKRPVPVGEWCDRDNWDILLVDEWSVYEGGELVPVEELPDHEETVPAFDI